MNANVPSVPDRPGDRNPLQADDISQLFLPLNSFSKIALAVSGGADSTCLLVTFADWRVRSGWTGQCEVLTVDHQLRPESRQEACFVQALCAASGLPCTVLDWSGEKPSSGVQEAARDARYRLIADHIATSGAEVLLVAHHRDDQAETFLDRLTRGSGLAGLSSMAQDERNGPFGLRLIRPFLDVPKEQLIATLKDREQRWCEDASNANLKYKRSRLRTISSLLAAEGLSADRISTTVRQLRRARTALDAALAQIFMEHVEEHSAGPLRINSLAYSDQAEEFRLRLLIAMIERVTGQAHQPKLRQIEALDQWILSQKTGRKPLGGAMFELKDPAILVWKEVGREAPVTLEKVTGTGSWDNRFIYTVGSDEDVQSDGKGLCLGPLCCAPVNRKVMVWPDGWPKEAFDCSPVFWSGSCPVRVRPVAPLIWHDKSGGVRDISLQRIPVPPKFGGNYRMDLEES